MTELDELRSAIQALEEQRAVLGERASAAIDILRERLRALESAAAPAETGEWKQVTVLFADLSGFTALSEETNAEEVRNSVNACFQLLGEIVRRYGGYVDKFIGDEIMALFGAPDAIEDHASRALYAALDMREALAKFSRENRRLRERPLLLHIGVNSGLIVAGTIGIEGKRDYTVMGDAVNVAARLVARAEPGTILVGAATYALGGHDFELDQPSLLDLEGHTPVEASRLLRAYHRVPHRGGPRMRTAMLGRDSELAAMEQALEAALAAGRAQAVLVVGPAGIGKSRLQTEFRRRLGEEHPQVRVFQGAAYPHTVLSSYFPIADLLRNWLGADAADSAAEIRARLSAGLTHLGITNSGVEAPLASLLAVEVEDGAFQRLLPEEKRAATFSAIQVLAEHLAALGPIIFSLEDVHWADDLSFELLEQAVRGAQGPILFVATSRSSTDPAAEARRVESRLGEAGYRRVVLSELDEGTSARLVAALAPGIERAPQVVKAILDQGQGNPFFLEAITMSLLERGILVADADGVRPRAPEVTLEIPATVWDVLAGRIDHLPAREKHILQTAAVVGRLFWEGLVGDLARASASDSLDFLAQRELVDLRGPAPFFEDWEWQFRHVLLQEVAYGGLLLETRKEAHARAGHWLEERAGDRRGEYLAILARHFSLGESWEASATYSELAGDQAAERFAYSEARSFYLQALAALKHLEGGEEVRSRQIALTLKLSGASFYTPTEEIYGAITDARALATAGEDHESAVLLMAAEASWQFMAGQGPAAVETASQTIARATEANQERLLSVPFSILGKAMFLLGQYDQCEGVLNRSRLLAEGPVSDALTRYHLVPTLGYLGMVYELRGDVERMRETQAQCLRLAEQRRDIRQTAAAHIYRGSIASVHGNVAAAKTHLSQAVALLEERGDRVALFVALGHLGFAYAQENDLESARSMLDRALGIAAELDSLIFVPQLRAFRADADIRAGRLDAALERANDAVQLATATRQREGEGQARRVLAWAHFYSAPGMPAEAESQMLAAVELARACNTPIIESRRLFELAEIYDRGGHSREAARARQEARTLAVKLGAHWLPVAPPVPLSPPA